MPAMTGNNVRASFSFDVANEGDIYYNYWNAFEDTERILTVPSITHDTYVQGFEFSIYSFVTTQKD